MAVTTWAGAKGLDTRRLLGTPLMPTHDHCRLSRRQFGCEGESSRPGGRPPSHPALRRA